MADEITQEQYISRHTGEEIDNAVDNATLVLANPKEEATEELTKLNIANTIFSIAAGGSSVIVRTWSDTEDE
jgi:hypothetical protein